MRSTSKKKKLERIEIKRSAEKKERELTSDNAFANAFIIEVSLENISLLRDIIKGKKPLALT